MYIEKNGVDVNKVTLNTSAMVYAFIIHTLFPGQCKVLFYQIYSTENNTEKPAPDTRTGPEHRQENKSNIEYVASQVKYTCTCVYSVLTTQYMACLHI